MGSTGNKKAGAGVGTTQTQGSEKLSNQKLENFQKMSYGDAQKFVHDIYVDTKKNADNYTMQGMNSFNAVQGLVEHMDLHQKPVVLPDAEFDKQVSANALDGHLLYRGFGSDEFAPDYVQQFMFGDKTFIGNGVHDEGIYMTNSPAYAADYADYNDLANSTITAFIDKSKAKVISEPDLEKLYAQTVNKNQSGGFATLSSFALYMGYNVISVPGGNNGKSHDHDGDFYLPLTREVLVVREHSKVGGKK